MAHLVKDLDNLQIQYGYKNGKEVATLLVWNAEMTEIEAELPLAVRAAKVLAEHGISFCS